MNTRWRRSSKFTSAGGIYYVLSTLFPAIETFLDKPILADDVTPSASERSSVNEEKKSSAW
jgi:hypothetical protein